ncbi:NusG domain II-containing protein [Halanaerobaculum tunisiense]
MKNKLVLSRLNQLMTLADKMLVLAVLLISILLIFLTPRIIAGETSGEKEVVVTLDQQEIARYELTDNQDLKKIPFNFTAEGDNYQGVLQMKEGQVQLERLSKDISPLPIHAEMGWISQPHEMIVSMPVKLTVKIESQKENSNDQQVDLRTY